MENENKKRRRARKPRQQWNPHWILKLLYMVGSVAFSLLKIAVGAAATVVLIVLVCGAVFVGTLGDYLQDDILLEAANWSIDDYGMDETSFVYYVDGGGNIQQLQQIYTTTDRQIATLDEIPQALINATVAIEDKRFYEHQGVDWITTVKACMNMFFGGDSQFGGSTVTQQLIKNVTDQKSVTVQRKVMEIFRAQVFEREYDKDTIMEEYLNRIYLGRGCYGVRSAAAEYFGKELQSLTVAECASLISITNNPSLFNPYSASVYEYKGEERDGAGRNRYRQLNVLSEMLDQGYLTQAEYDEAVAQEMVFKSGIEEADKWAVCPNGSCRYEGTMGTFNGADGNYFCPYCGTQTTARKDASQHIYSWYVDAVLVDVAADFAAADGFNWDDLDDKMREVYLERIQKGGYHIYTPLDMKVQQQVDAIYGDLSNIPRTNSQQQLQSAIVVIDNDTGDVVALSGGVGEKDTFYAYNKATQAKLQTGSAQKPVSVYAPAFEVGAVSPATVIKDLPVYYENGQGWPKNDNRQYQYARTVYQGIVSSVNTISVRTLDKIGYDYAYSFAKYNLGQSNLIEEYPLEDGRSLSDLDRAPLALGALTVGSTVRDMSAAYATFANDGVYREPRLYTKVYNSNGDLILDNVQEQRQVLSTKTVNYVNYCLYNAANHGTGGAAIFGGQSIAGKTGTTSSNRDRWFCGYTSHYTAAVWCGYNIPEQIHVNGNPAAQLWRKVMQPVHAGLGNEGLFNAGAMQNVNICLDSGLRASDACYNDARGIDRVVSVMCYAEDVPGGVCTKHVSVHYCVDGGGVANEYCSMYGDANVQTRSLVKLTPAEVREIRDAGRSGLVDAYLNNGYVYYVDEGGNELEWTGFHGGMVSGAPYMTCTVHDEAYFDDSDFGDDWTDDEFGNEFGGYDDFQDDSDEDWD